MYKLVSYISSHKPTLRPIIFEHGCLACKANISWFNKQTLDGAQRDSVFDSKITVNHMSE